MLSSAVCSYFRTRHIISAAKLIGINHQQSYANCEVNNSYNIMNYRLMAGHSKWQNIKHIKAAKDQEKAKEIGKYAHLVRVAVREKGPDPKLNSRLADLLEEARKRNVPSATLENAMKRATNAKLKSGLIEVSGPGGCYVLLDYETDNISMTRHSIKVICKKYNTGIASGEGRWRAFYEQKGILKVTRTSDGQVLDAEKALDVAIEAGAEDVQLKTSEDETPFLEFYCEPGNLFPVKKEVEERCYIVEEAFIGFIANVTVEMSDEVMDTASNFFAELAELPEIIRIYENVQ